MKSYSMGFALAVLAMSLQTSFAAEVSGKVKLKGTPKPEMTIQLDQVCGKLQADKPVTTRHFVVGQDNGLANVFVYVKEGAKPAPPAGEAPVLDQKDCMYQPYVFGAQVGQKIKIKNSDPFMHNVHATPQKNKEFNFAQPLPMVTERAFDQPEVVVRMKCDVHPWMFAYAGVVEHPYFAVTGKDGSFKIANLPAGTYTIEAFHQKIGPTGAKTQQITVTDSDKKTVDFELMAPPPAP